MIQQRLQRLQRLQRGPCYMTQKNEIDIENRVNLSKTEAESD